MKPYLEQRHAPGRRRVDKAVLVTLLAAALATGGWTVRLIAQSINQHFVTAEAYQADQAQYRRDRLADSLNRHLEWNQMRSAMDSGFLSLKGCVKHGDC